MTMAKIKKPETFEGCIMLFRIFEANNPFAQIVKRRVYKYKDKEEESYYINFKGIKLITHLTNFNASDVHVLVNVKEWKAGQIKAIEEKYKKPEPKRYKK